MVISSYSPYLRESIDEENNYQKSTMIIFRTHIVKMNNLLNMKAHQYALKMRRIASQKLMEKGLEEENNRLQELKRRLKEEFGKCLWEKAQQRQRGKGTTEDLYWWYKKQVGMSTTPSELAIRLGRKTTKGLLPK